MTDVRKFITEPEQLPTVAATLTAAVMASRGKVVTPDQALAVYWGIAKALKNRSPYEAD